MSKKKQIKTEKIVQHLSAQTNTLLPTDNMAEAGRKVLQGEFIKMLDHEAGSRSGADLEDVHKMRVAIRQQRSIFRLLADYYKPKVVRTHVDSLKHVMGVLGPVRDLDVMIENLHAFAVQLEAPDAATLRDVIESLDQRRGVARVNLVQVLNHKSYRRWVSSYTEFLSTAGAGARSFDDDEVQPIQVRHVLPPMIYEHLAAVRAYDAVLPDAEVEVLHALRIEFKRLRYVVTLFSSLLGKEIDDYVDELRQLQDLLGRLNDIQVARDTLADLMEDLEGPQNAVLWIYLEQLEKDEPQLKAEFPDVWKRFNTKTVQRKLANAVLAL